MISRKKIKSKPKTKLMTLGDMENFTPFDRRPVPYSDDYVTFDNVLPNPIHKNGFVRNMKQRINERFDKVVKGTSLNPQNMSSNSVFDQYLRLTVAQRKRIPDMNFRGYQVDESSCRLYSFEDNAVYKYELKPVVVYKRYKVLGKIRDFMESNERRLVFNNISKYKPVPAGSIEFNKATQNLTHSEALVPFMTNADITTLNQLNTTLSAFNDSIGKLGQTPLATPVQTPLSTPAASVVNNGVQSQVNIDKTPKPQTRIDMYKGLYPNLNDSSSVYYKESGEIPDKKYGVKRAELSSAKITELIEKEMWTLSYIFIGAKSRKTQEFVIFDPGVEPEEAADVNITNTVNNGPTSESMSQLNESIKANTQATTGLTKAVNDKSAMMKVQINRLVEAINSLNIKLTKPEIGVVSGMEAAAIADQVIKLQGNKMEIEQPDLTEKLVNTLDKINATLSTLPDSALMQTFVTRIKEFCQQPTPQNMTKIPQALMDNVADINTKLKILFPSEEFMSEAVKISRYPTFFEIVTGVVTDTVSKMIEGMNASVTKLLTDNARLTKEEQERRIQELKTQMIQRFVGATKRMNAIEDSTTKRIHAIEDKSTKQIKDVEEVISVNVSNAVYTAFNTISGVMNMNTGMIMDTVNTNLASIQQQITDGQINLNKGLERLQLNNQMTVKLLTDKAENDKEALVNYFIQNPPLQQNILNQQFNNYDYSQTMNIPNYYYGIKNEYNINRLDKKLLLTDETQNVANLLTSEVLAQITDDLNTSDQQVAPMGEEPSAKKRRLDVHERTREALNLTPEELRREIIGLVSILKPYSKDENLKDFLRFIGAKKYLYCYLMKVDDELINRFYDDLITGDMAREGFTVDRLQQIGERMNDYMHYLRADIPRTTDENLNSLLTQLCRLVLEDTPGSTQGQVQGQPQTPLRQIPDGVQN